VRSPTSLSRSMHLWPRVRPCQLRRNPSPENLIGQVPSLAPAQRAYSYHPRVRHRGHGCRDVLSTLLALHCEVAHPFRGAMKHGGSIGEQKANLFHKTSTSSRSKQSGPCSRVFVVSRGGEPKLYCLSLGRVPMYQHTVGDCSTRGRDAGSP
jgi:hypothetical protein